jgi:hypothetical protein
MKEAIFLLVHLLLRVPMLLRPGGVRARLAENLLLKQQLPVLERSRRRAPNFLSIDRLLLAFWTLFLNSRWLLRVAIVSQALNPAALPSRAH